MNTVSMVVDVTKQSFWKRDYSMIHTVPESKYTCASGPRAVLSSESTLLLNIESCCEYQYKIQYPSSPELNFAVGRTLFSFSV